MTGAAFLQTTLMVSDAALAACFATALDERPVGAPGGFALVAQASGGLTGLAEDVSRAIDDFIRRDDARALVLVSAEGGVGWDALQGLTRSLAAALAPRARVNAIAPARAGDALDHEQAAKALLYLLGAEAVTGQTVFTGVAA